MQPAKIASQFYSTLIETKWDVENDFLTLNQNKKQLKQIKNKF